MSNLLESSKENNVRLAKLASKALIANGRIKEKCGVVDAVVLSVSRSFAINDSKTGEYLCEGYYVTLLVGNTQLAGKKLQKCVWRDSFGDVPEIGQELKMYPEVVTSKVELVNYLTAGFFMRNVLEQIDDDFLID